MIIQVGTIHRRNSSLSLSHVPASPEFRSVVADLRKSLCTLIVDESHRAAAPSYRSILNKLVANGVRVVGLTATLFRMEYNPKDQDAGTTELRNLFPLLIEPTRTLTTHFPSRPSPGSVDPVTVWCPVPFYIVFARQPATLSRS